MSPKQTNDHMSAAVAVKEPSFPPLNSRFRGTKTVQYMLLRILSPYPRNSRWPPVSILISPIVHNAAAATAKTYTQRPTFSNFDVTDIVSLPWWCYYWRIEISAGCQIVH